MTVLSIPDALANAEAAGFQGNALLTVVAIAMAESGLNTDAVNVNADQWQSRDRGILQINDHWHPEVSDTCAFDPVCSFRSGWTISASGTDFSPWTTYTTGIYTAHIAAVQASLPPQPDATASLLLRFAQDIQKTLGG